MFAVTPAAATARRQWLKSLGVARRLSGRRSTLSAYAYQRSVSLLLAWFTPEKRRSSMKVFLSRLFPRRVDAPAWIEAAELRRHLAAGAAVVVVDVRQPEEFAAPRATSPVRSTCRWPICQAASKNLLPGDNRSYWFVRLSVGLLRQRQSCSQPAYGMSLSFVAEQTGGTGEGWRSNNKAYSLSGRRWTEDSQGFGFIAPNSAGARSTAARSSPLSCRFADCLDGTGTGRVVAGDTVDQGAERRAFQHVDQIGNVLLLNGFLLYQQE